MTISTVAIFSPGEMGSAVGRALGSHGFEVITSLDGRGEGSRARAAEAGFRDVGSVEAALGEADIVFSILPPEYALATAEMVAGAMGASGFRPAYIDCNAVAPETANRIGTIIGDAGAEFIDGGIVGSPPGKTDKATRFFVSGPGAPLMAAFDSKGIDVRQCGPELGKASAVKMCYAGITKGTSALHANMLMAAELLGVADELHEELAYSVAPLYKRMETMTPALPAVAERYVGEMREIEKTLVAVDMPGGFHAGAAELYELLDRSPYANERRETVDRSRTLRQTIEGCVAALSARDAAE
jgi:3-hydroxyisobutyrate dehydrogenase-like beta-hydroxyacid dehydrogenase